MVKNALDWIVGSGDLYGKFVALLRRGDERWRLRPAGPAVRTLSWQGGARRRGASALTRLAPSRWANPTGRAGSTNPSTIDEIGASSCQLLVASVTQRPSERFAAVAKLAPGRRESSKVPSLIHYRRARRRLGYGVDPSEEDPKRRVGRRPPGTNPSGTWDASVGVRPSSRVSSVGAF